MRAPVRDFAEGDNDEYGKDRLIDRGLYSGSFPRRGQLFSEYSLFVNKDGGYVC